MKRRRLDRELVRRQLAGSEQEAAALVQARRVTVGGAPAMNARRLVRPDEAVIVLDEPPQFVTRAGDKLAPALAHFQVPVERARALDAGASGGGFTDCLLQHGAQQVVAVDVGYGQLHERLRTDPRVEVRDRTNIRNLAPGALGPPFDLIVADLSFISLQRVIAQLIGHGRDGSDLLLLIKPQFEATHAEASEGRGVITDPTIHERVIGEVSAAIESAGATVKNVMPSEAPGTRGNLEFLLHAKIQS